MREEKAAKECRVLCTPVSFGRKDASLRPSLEAAVAEVVSNPFGRPLTAAELRPLVTDIDGYIAGVDEIDSSVIACARQLKIVSCYGVGFDHVDIAAATARGVLVTNSAGANSAAVAELTISLMLALARHLVMANDSVKSGKWPILDGISIMGKTVGLIGLGAIGREVSLRLKCFGCRLVAYDPFVAPDFAKNLGMSLLSLEEVLSQADFLSLHVPVMGSTRGMVDKGFLEQMKDGAFLINTARGDLIDEEALWNALQSRRLRGVALDCFSKEPPDVSNQLLRLPQVIVTPHTGAHTDDALNRMGWTALQNCLAALNGQIPDNIVNPEVLRGV
jgi:D-3-phosphoglycerate dehydrogenase / 2-oxoglutarate reductase